MQFSTGQIVGVGVTAAAALFSSMILADRQRVAEAIVRLETATTDNATQIKAAVSINATTFANRVAPLESQVARNTEEIDRLRASGSPAMQTRMHAVEAKTDRIAAVAQVERKRLMEAINAADTRTHTWIDQLWIAEFGVPLAERQNYLEMIDLRGD